MISVQLIQDPVELVLVPDAPFLGGYPVLLTSGYLVTKRWKTTYEDGGLSLYLNEYEICYFEIVCLIKSLGYTKPKKNRFKLFGYTLYASRKEIKDDKDTSKLIGSF